MLSFRSVFVSALRVAGAGASPGERANNSELPCDIVHRAHVIALLLACSPGFGTVCGAQC